MVASISFSGRECRHADEIFAFPARTEFSVTTAWSRTAVASAKPSRLHPAPAPSPPGDGPRSASPAGVSYLGWRSFPSAAADSIPAIRPEHNRLAATSESVDSFLVPAGRRRRAIAPQRSCVDSADCDSEGDESSPGPAPAAPARADRANGEHSCCDKKLPIPYSSGHRGLPRLRTRKTISRSICSTASNTSNSGSGNDLCTISMVWLTTPT
jgi:hypothetical protein